MLYTNILRYLKDGHYSKENIELKSAIKNLINKK
ncbi:hypothetical protein BACCIP111899_00020 [Bacillus rhizoplanae]|uniref:Fur-regulated basic protein FbpA n=1 Tax=Bacillus rhizoplanae TaxID=2880966 RepID=A0ABM8Y567_9BACI|nr:hypothetical protein BACCIP111899_00020 [Bacillus rhizoplanae]